MSADEEAAKAIPAEVRMISGCRDSQTSADVSNVASFQLPDPAGRSGGACTSALLKVLYNESGDLSFQEILYKMRDILGDGGYTQIPQLTSSRCLDVSCPFTLKPDDFSGTCRAVIIGINYVGQNGELSGCHNDANNMMEYLINEHGFQSENMTILMDDGENEEPTRENILNAFKNLVNSSEAGDACFLHYSGHGGKVRDDDGDEEDGYDETLIPVDYQSAGQIRDDDVFTTLVGAMPAGVTLTCLMDCCHSGSILDLPFKFVADGESEGMSFDESFDFGKLLGLAAALAGISAGDGFLGNMMSVASCLADTFCKDKF